jgi:DNA-binding transcriptional MerR regulator
VKKENFTYRTYNISTALKLQQIIILRKLRIPLRQVAEILNSKDTVAVIKVFQQSLFDIEDEITALSTIRSITKALLDRFDLLSDKLRLLDDRSLLEIVDSLTVSKTFFKEDKSLEELNQASEKLNNLTDVRIVYLPPMTVAAVSAVGENCEGQATAMINRFVVENNLLRIKPDIRFFGFDCSAGTTGIGEPSRKYQTWVTIPDDMVVPLPLIKRVFSGGLYAAHMIKMGDFDHWTLLRKWVMNNDKYEHDWYSIRCAPYEDDMERCFEEQLNYWSNLQNAEFENNEMQLDLLFPVKEKQ